MGAASGAIERHNVGSLGGGSSTFPRKILFCYAVIKCDLRGGGGEHSECEEGLMVDLKRLLCSVLWSVGWLLV